MKKRLSFALSLSLLCESSFASFFSGNDLHEWLQEKEKTDGSRFKIGLFNGYVAGIVDVGDSFLFCTGSGVTAGQYSAVVAKYLNNNPEKWNLTASSLVVQALNEAFPCKK